MRARQDQEDLTRVGPGTVMGDFMRQYWIPAAKSGELAAGAAPIRLMLLGEKLVAFRDDQGRVGVFDHRCPHRGVSLFLGRNEPGGLRCVYHGWKFDVRGNCLEMPSTPPELDFSAKVKARAYRTAERAGVVWVYMGDRPEPPPLPEIEAALLPSDELDVLFIQRDCNWLQALEGDIDTAHVGFLHLGHIEPDDIPGGHYLEHTLTPRSPKYNARDTPWGTAYGAYRNVNVDGSDKNYWRFGHFMFPFWTQFPMNELRDHIHARAWVPLDDEHTMTVFLRWRHTPVKRQPLHRERHLPPSHKEEFLPPTSDWLGRYRVTANAGNDWLIDRDAQTRNFNFTGIESFFLQDQAVTESMGPAVDHALEHLGPSDMMIARTRRRLLAEARKFRETGQPPAAVDEPACYLGARGGHFVAPAEADWIAVYRDQVGAALGPAKGRRSW